MNKFRSFMKMFIFFCLGWAIAFSIAGMYVRDLQERAERLAEQVKIQQKCVTGEPK